MGCSLPNFSPKLESLHRTLHGLNSLSVVVCKFSKYEKSNLSANDRGCIEMEEVSYLSHIAIGNAVPPVEYVESFKLICQLISL